MFFILNEEKEVVDFTLTKTLSHDELRPIHQKLKDRIGDTILQYVLTDLCCEQRSFYGGLFPNALVRLDLFHAVQRLTRKISKEDMEPQSKTFVVDAGLIFRRENDRGDRRLGLLLKCFVVCS